MSKNSLVYLEVPPYEGEVNTTYIELTVTSSLDISMATQVSSNPTLSSQVVADNAVNQNRMYNIQGVISNNLNTQLLEKGYQKKVVDNLNLLQKARNNKKILTLHFDSANLQPPVPNCLITSLNFSKASSMGTSYNVSLALKEILLTNEQLISSEQFESEAVENQASTEGSTKPVATTEVENFSYLQRGISATTNFIFDSEPEITKTEGGE